MTQLFSHLQTSVGRKLVVAVTGLGLVTFVIAHMLGNLQVFEGPHALNSYGAALRTMPILLWAVRLGLVGIVVLHLVLALRLQARNLDARPIAYGTRTYRRASLASRTMAVSGTVLLLFVVFHVLHLTAGVIPPSLGTGVDGEGHRDVYGKVVHAFQNPVMVALYLLGQLALVFHVSHGVSSGFQTLGLEYTALNRLFKAAGPVVALIVALGNVAIILAIFLGIVRA